jgi:hypothetical protein
MTMKPFWKSRVVWVNGLALAALVLQEATGQEVLSPEAQLGILALANAVLRFRTEEPIGR